VDICGYELPTNLQNFTQKDLTEVKIFQKFLGRLLFWNTLYSDWMKILSLVDMHYESCFPWELITSMEYSRGQGKVNGAR